MKNLSKYPGLPSYFGRKEVHYIENCMTILIMVIVVSVVAVLCWELTTLTEQVRLDSQWPR